MSAAVTPNTGSLSQTPSSMPATSPHYGSTPHSYSPHNAASSVYSDGGDRSFPPSSASMPGHHGPNGPSPYYANANPGPSQYSSTSHYAARPFDYPTPQAPWHPTSRSSGPPYLVGPGEYPAPPTGVYYARQDISVANEPLPAHDDTTSDHPSPASRRSSVQRQSPEIISSGSKPRSASNRPSGLQKCKSCETTSSPEWRKGPSGLKELCNACGLRWARGRAKSNGTAGQRKAQTHLQRQTVHTPGTIQFSHHNPHEPPVPGGNKRRKTSGIKRDRDESPSRLSTQSGESASPSGYSYATPASIASGYPPSGSANTAFHYSDNAPHPSGAVSDGPSPSPSNSYSTGSGSKRSFGAYEAGQQFDDYDHRYEDPMKRLLLQNARVLPSLSHAHPTPSSSAFTPGPAQTDWSVSAKSGRARTGPSPLSSLLRHDRSVPSEDEIATAEHLRDVGNGLLDTGRPAAGPQSGRLVPERSMEEHILPSIRTTRK